MDEPPHLSDVAGRSTMELEILQLLLLRADDQPWFPITEVVRQTADPIVALDALTALWEVGLVRRRGRYLMLSPAAVRLFQLITWP
jgi:hypothetical protein